MIWALLLLSLLGLVGVCWPRKPRTRVYYFSEAARRRAERRKQAREADTRPAFPPTVPVR